MGALPLGQTLGRSSHTLHFSSSCRWVFYIFAGFALLWLPMWWPVSTVDDKLRGPINEYGALETTEAVPVAGEADTPPFLQPHRGPLPAVPGSPSGSESKTPRGLWALMRRREVWAICVAQYCQSWGMYGLLSWLPSFFQARHFACIVFRQGYLHVIQPSF